MWLNFTPRFHVFVFGVQSNVLISECVAAITSCVHTYPLTVVSLFTFVLSSDVRVTPG